MQKQLNILVTGGAGFIGSAVIENLQSLGHSIHVIDNLSFGNRKFLTIPDTHFHNVDILNSVAIDSLIQTISPDWLIHLAAFHSLL
jgi:UDP-glucose 4-epimerase